MWNVAVCLRVAEELESVWSISGVIYVVGIFLSRHWNVGVGLGLGDILVDVYTVLNSMLMVAHGTGGGKAYGDLLNWVVKGI